MLLVLLAPSWLTVDTMSSSFLLCSSCRHSYPSSSFREASFGVKSRETFQSIQSIVAKVNGKTAEDDHHLHTLSAALQNLCGLMHEEVQILKDKLEASEEKMAKKETALEEANRKVLRATVQSAKAVLMPGVVVGGSSTTSSANGLNSGTTPPLPSYNPHLANRKPFSGVPDYNIKRMSTALELVSASIYSLLESLAIHARVDTALLWVRPRNLISNELVAPFVVGRDMSKLTNSAPYRVSETSVPCAVSLTGIAVNLKPQPGISDTRRSEDIPLTELLEQTNAPQLLLPVNARYDDQVLAVVHLIGSPRYPFPFSRRNEEAAKYAATFFSIILSSHHETMVNEWSNHFYEPSMAHCTSTYKGDLDLRGDEKCVDDFSPPPMLIYRAVNPSPPAPTHGGGGGHSTSSSQSHHNHANNFNNGGGATDPREAFMNLKLAMSKKAVAMNPVAAVKDLHLHAMNMETNWVGAVRALSELENYVNTYRNGQMKEEVNRLREEREKAKERAERNAIQFSWQKMSRGSLKSLKDNKAGGDDEVDRLDASSVSVADDESVLGGATGSNAEGGGKRLNVKFPPLRASFSGAAGAGGGKRRLTACVSFGGSGERKTDRRSSHRSSIGSIALLEGKGKWKERGSIRSDRSSVTSSRASSINSVDLALELSPAVIARENSLDPSDVLKPEEMEDAEALALKRLRYLGVDTTPFTQASRE